MWGEALSMLDRAQRLQRQFFTHANVAWEPPVDIVETGDTLQMHVALPGVSADAITVALDPPESPSRRCALSHAGAKTARSIASRSPTAASSASSACRSATRTAPLELADKSLQDGILTLTFRRKESP